MKRVDRTAADLDRPEGNDLESNYDVHDVGEIHLKQHLEHMGFVAENWGIDRRHDDDGLLFDDKMDLKVYDAGESPVVDASELLETVDYDSQDESGRQVSEGDVVDEDDLTGIIEIKTKRNEDWFGVINRRHFRKYLVHAHEFDVPTFVYMSLVDEERNTITRDTFVPIQQWDELTAVRNDEYDYYTSDDVDTFLVEQVDNHPQIESTWRAPDGNQVVTLDLSTGLAWPALTGALYE